MPDQSKADSRSRVGLIGCGVVGRRLGARLLQAEFPLAAYDRNADRVDALVSHGATRAADIATLGHECDVVVTALPRSEDVLAAVLGSEGLYAQPRRPLTHIDTSTIGVACARTISAEAAAHKVRYLDAPLSAAESGDGGQRLTLFVSGNADHYDLAKPVLGALAEHVHFLGGPPGTGQVVKLVNNLTTHGLTALLGEALALGVKAGVPIEMLRGALHDGTAQCRLLDESLPASAMRGDWRPGLRLDLALKDLALADELAREVGVESTILEPVRSLFERARDRGWGDLTSHAVLRVTEEAAGVSFRSLIFESIGPNGVRDDEP